MLFSWARTLLTARRPYLLHWRIGDAEHCRVYAHLLDALLASQETLAVPGIETMALTDRDGRPLPVPAYALLTWRWCGMAHSEVLVGRRARERRLRGLLTNDALEFVSLKRSDGRALLTRAEFVERQSSRCRSGESAHAPIRRWAKESHQPPPSPTP